MQAAEASANARQAAFTALVHVGKSTRIRPDTIDCVSLSLGVAGYQLVAKADFPIRRSKCIRVSRPTVSMCLASEMKPTFSEQ